MAAASGPHEYPRRVEVRRITSHDPVAVARLSEFVDQTEQAHGHPLISDNVRLVLRDPSRGDDLTAVLAFAHEEPIGCAIACPANGSTVVEVLAPHEHSLGPPTEVVARLIEEISQRERPTSESLVWWCRDHEPWADAVATRLGLVEHRRLLQMRVRLASDRVANYRTFTVPTRPFRPGVDDAIWLALNNRAFADHGEQGNWSASDLRRRLAAPWFDASGFLLHPAEGEPHAFCWTKVHPADSHDPALGEIYVIAVDPDHGGQGLGRALTCAGLVHLAESGIDIGMLHVDASNTAAVGLYQSLGMVVHHVDRAFLVPQRPVPS